MTSEELLIKLEEIKKTKCETQTLEIKAAEKGCPQRLYDTLSVFSNQDDGGITLSAVMLFCKYPQVFFPQLCITAVVVPGEEIGDIGAYGERFLDNRRIEGNIPEMLDQAITFISNNIHNKTIINPMTGKREDRADYPLIAIREAVINALVHRDYSIHTEGMPIQIIIFPNRIEIKNPGGLYGRMQIDQLGKMQPDTRNPVLVTALEIMNITENRYSGIPTIRRMMKEYGLPELMFEDQRGTFVVTLYNSQVKERGIGKEVFSGKERELLGFLSVPRNRQEIAEFLNIRSTVYAIQTYITPLIEKGLVRQTIPAKPKSPSQRFVAVK